MTVDSTMAEIEKFLVAGKNVFLSESEKKHFEQLLEDLFQTSYNEGFDKDCFSVYGEYDAGCDFVPTLVNCVERLYR